MAHRSRIQERHPNSKFSPGSKAHEKRKEQLAKIVARMGDTTRVSTQLGRYVHPRVCGGRAFGDLQGAA